MSWFHRTAKAEVGENPYTNAKQHWNAHESEILSSRTMWQIVGITCLLVALCSVGGIVYIGQQSKFIPYVIEVDKLGQSISVGVANKASPVDERVMHATIAAWISDARMVTPDTTVQRSAIFRLYAHLPTESAAIFKMHSYLQNDDTNPFKRAAEETVHVSITSVIPQSPKTWQVDWVEEVRDRQGALVKRTNMRALISVTIEADVQVDEEQIRRNPLGIYIQDFNWSKQV